MTRALVRLAVIVVCLALAACAGLLGLKPKTTGMHPFEHRAHILKGVSCLECHSGIASAGDVGPLHVPETATCTKCHEKPHDTHDCNGCHGAAHTRAARRARARASPLRASRARPRRQRRVRALSRRRRRVAPRVDAPADGRLPRMSPSREAVRRARLRGLSRRSAGRAHPPREPRRPRGRLRPRARRPRRERARPLRHVPLRALLQRLPRRDDPGLPARLAFDKPALGGLHRAGFRSRHKEEARGQPGLCTTCHSEDSCRACHARENVGATGMPGRSPHPRSWLTAGKGGGDHGMPARIDPGVVRVVPRRRRRAALRRLSQGRRRRRQHPRAGLLEHQEQDARRALSPLPRAQSMMSAMKRAILVVAALALIGARDLRGRRSGDRAARLRR